MSRARADGGFILRAGSDLLFPLLLVAGLYIVIHGHLTPGGGFQGGVILAAAFFLPLLARPRTTPGHRWLMLIEGLAGASFITIGLIALYQGEAFLTPLFDRGTLGELVSSGSLPLLYLAVGLKVGAELAGLLILVAGVFYLNPFRDSLVLQRERGLVVEAELIAEVVEARAVAAACFLAGAVADEGRRREIEALLSQAGVASN